MIALWDKQQLEVLRQTDGTHLRRFYQESPHIELKARTIHSAVP